VPATVDVLDGAGVSRTVNTLPALGSAVSASSLPVVIASDQGTVPVKSGVTVTVSTSFTRPADTTAYAVGDLVANNVTAGSVVPLTFANVVRTAGGGGMIRRMKLRASSTVLTNASFRLNLYTTAPATVTNGDNGVFSTSGVADFIGSIFVTLDRAFTDGAIGFGTAEINLDLPSSNTSIFGLLEAQGIYTPTSAETFAVDLDILQD
jgi:hypothetical protein